MRVKGKKLSAESIEKMKQSKIKRMQSKYIWGLAELYLDIDVNNGAGKRIDKYITLREFKNYVLSGVSLKEIASKGVSRKIIQFFSNFCQGKIKFTKEQFEESYKQGMSLDEICKDFLVTHQDITSLRQLYDIKRRGATYINRKKTEVPLTQRQKDILYGSMMGDAKRLHTRWNSIAAFKHSDKQEEYLKWKFEEFKSVTKKETLKFAISTDKREEYKGHYGCWSFYTRANSDIEECINKFYSSGKKEIDRDILDNLSELSLAVWFGDDGYSDKNKHGISNYIFCTDSFSEESVDNIIEWFNDKWGIKAHKRKRQLKYKVGFRVVIKAESGDEFYDLIRPHFIPSMLYKINYEAYKKKRHLKSENI